MRKVSLDRKTIDKHRATYSNVVWEIVDLLAQGKDVKIGDYSSRKAAGVSWANDYFAMLCSLKKKGDLICAKPKLLQKAINAEMKFLCSQGYVLKDEKICTDDKLSKGKQKQQKKNLKSVRDLCSHVFDYDLFVNAKTLRRDESGGYTYRRVKTNPNWGGDPFRMALNVKYCLYCNIDDVFNHDLSRSTNGAISNTISHIGFDHYFEKSLYPFLALSIYNLIPCCDRCNQKYKTQRIMNTSRHSHPYINDFDELMKFDLMFKKLKEIQGKPKEAPLTLTRRMKNPSEEKLAEGFSDELGLPSIYRQRAIDETMHVVRAMDQRLADCENYRVKRKNKEWIAAKNLADFSFDLSKDAINNHRCAKLTIDLVDAYCREKQLD